MTEEEQTELIHQINRYMNLSAHQMDALIGALHYIEWEPKMNKNSDLMSTAPLPNYNAATPVRCEPPEGTKNGTYHVHVNGRTKRMCKWENQRWCIPDQNSQTPGEAGRYGWRYSHELSLDPPHPHPHAALRDAVVEAAMSVAQRRGGTAQDIWDACDALTVAQTTPSPAEGLRRAMAAVTMIGPSEVAAHLEIAINRAIAALEQGDGT